MSREERQEAFVNNRIFMRSYRPLHPLVRPTGTFRRREVTRSGWWGYLVPPTQTEIWYLYQNSCYVSAVAQVAEDGRIIGEVKTQPLFERKWDPHPEFGSARVVNGRLVGTTLTGHIYGERPEVYRDHYGDEDLRP